MTEPLSASEATGAIPAGVRQLSGELRAAIEEGIAHQRQRRFREAEAAYRRVLAEHPEQPDTLNLLGAMIVAAGGFDEALRLLRRAVELRPEEATFRGNLAGVLMRLGRDDDALAELEAARAWGSDSPELAMNYARLLRRLGRAEEAIPLYRQVLERVPGFVPAMIGQARALAELGRAEAAAAILRDVVAAHPDDPIGHLELAGALRFGEDRGEVAAILALAGRAGMPPVERRRLLRAAGKICEDLARHDEAFAHYGAAAATLDPLAYDPERRAAQVSQLIAAFDPALFAALRGQGGPSAKPVFVAGLPGAGGATVAAMLTGRPDVAAAGEADVIGRIAAEFGPAIGSALPYPDAVRDLNGELMAQQANRYLRVLDRIAPAALRVVDRSPGLADHLGLIALLLPNARIIHCRRDPLANAVSVFTSGAGDAVGYGRDLAALGHYFRQHERLMDHWRRVLPREILEIRHDELLAAPEAVGRRLIEFVDLPAPGNASPLAGSKVAPPAVAPRWRNFERHLGPLTAELKF